MLYETKQGTKAYEDIKSILDAEFEEHQAYMKRVEDAVAYVVGMTGNPNITFDELEDLDDVFVTKLEYVS